MIGIDTKLDKLLRAALTEDIGTRDLTSSLIPPSNRVKADMIFKESALLCGMPIAERIFRLVDENLRFLPVAKDGEWIEKGRAVFYAEGSCRSILTAERVALNFLSLMSGVATKTHVFVEAVKGTGAKIYDTRKTVPLMRTLQRYAVKTGGGVNHRNGLYDGVLIKDNHLAALSIFSIPDIVKTARSRVSKQVPIGVEVKTIAELRAALDSKCDYILLDNFPVERIVEAVEIRKKAGVKIPLEVSGGVTLDNVKQYAQTGVERISVGALTHTVKAVDVSLNLLPS